ncbi:trypsin-like peptidase domain-containing protein [Streptomyces sp. NPDC014733]|uniref:S1C family serine protease n=1 Tax=Streptomyces sp. NPDC014733 TaxID=3364885 RepID=UPI00370231E8
MDDGTATGPKLKWWSRPGRTPDPQPHPGPGPQPQPVTAEGGAVSPPVPAAAGAPPAADTAPQPAVPAPVAPQPAAPAPVGPQPAVPDPTGPRSAAAAPVGPQPVAADGTVPGAPAPAGPQPMPVGEAGPQPAAAGPQPDASAGPQPAVPSGARPQPDDEWPPPEPLAATRASLTTSAATAPAADTPAPTAPAAPVAEAPAADAPAATPAPLPAAAPVVTTPAEAPAVEPATLQLTKAEPDAAPAPAAGAPAVPDGPRHPKDPYGTPPYGDPGPWAPAPPVQRPVTTPAHGTPLPQPGAAPAYGSAAPPLPGALPPQAPYADQPLPAERPVAPQPYPQGGNGTDGGGFVPRPGDGGPRSAVARTAALPVADAPLPPERPVPHPDASGDHGPLVPAHPGGAWQQYDPWSPPGHHTPAVQPPVRRARRGPLVVGAVVLALFAGCVGGAVGVYVERHGGPGDIVLPQADEAPGPRDPHSVAGIAQSALPGVVTLHVRGNAEQGTGTGFVLDRQGRILTNNHVVEPAGDGGEISVTFSGGQTAKARVVGRDSGYDLAVVQVDNVSGLHPLALGNSDAVRVGDPVVAIGAPYDLANTVTAGIISAKQRPITAGGEKGDGSDVSYVDALQTDAPINPGNSGGPLVDGDGRVIGINSAIRAADGSSPDGSTQGGSIGLGFAIPINQAKRVAEELINTGRATHPVIGVTLEMEYPGDGARVSGVSKDGRNPVTPGGPGAKAGIKGGDVITRLDGAPVHSGEELIVKIRSHRPGDALTLTLRRGGTDRTVHLTLGSSGTG